MGRKENAMPRHPPLLARLRCCSIGLVALALSFPAHAEFSQDDLISSSWFIYSSSDDPAGNAPAWTEALLELDASGNPASGDEIDSSGATASYTGGSLAISSIGLVSGSITRSPGGVDVLSGYKMSPSGNLLVGVDTDPQGRVRLDVGVRAGSGANDFSTSDLAGSWHLFGNWELPSTNDPGWDRGALTINNSGVVTNTSGSDSEGVSLDLTGLPLTADAAGEVTSNFLDGVLKLTPDRQMVIGVTTDEDSYLSLVVLIKTGGSFSTGDLAGRWYVHSLRDDPDGNDPRWVRTILDVGDDGAIAGGTVSESSGALDTVTGGSFSITSGGVVSGTIAYAVRPDVQITDFAMNSAHEVVAGVTTDADGIVSLSVAIVPEPSATATALAAISTLARLRGRRARSSRRA